MTDVIDRPWEVAASDVYYDVARARTTLRGRRDLIVTNEGTRVLVRVRIGAPGKSAGPGLRADLTIDALARPQGVRRRTNHWPVARSGSCLERGGPMATFVPAHVTSCAPQSRASDLTSRPAA